MSTETDATPVRSTSNVVALRSIAALAAIVLIVLAFFLGRASVSATSDSASEPKGDTETAAANGDDSQANRLIEEFAKKNNLTPEQDFGLMMNENGKQTLGALVKDSASPGRTLGKASAPITLTIFEDFSCPMCTVWQKETFPGLMKYVDSGAVKFQWHNMVIFGKEYRSDLAAQGSIAAMNQGKMWDFISAAYQEAGDGDHTVYDEATVMNIAKAAGIRNLEKFRSDMLSTQTIDIVKKETAAAHKAGIGGTPFFVLGDTVVSGAYPLEYFENTIKFQQFLLNS